MIDALKRLYPPDEYPACAAAVEAGVDVTLLETNLRLTPAERLAAMMRQLRLQHRLQAASLTQAQLEAIEQRRIREKLELYGPRPVLDPGDA